MRHDFVHIGLTKKMFLMTPNVGEDVVQETSYTVHQGDPFAKQALVCQVRMLPPVTQMPPLALCPGGTPETGDLEGTPGDAGGHRSSPAPSDAGPCAAASCHCPARFLQNGDVAALASGAVVRGRGTGRQAPHHSHGRTRQALAEDVGRKGRPAG